MGFRSGAYASVFSVVKGRGKFYDVRISTSRKNAATGGWEQDFGGFVRFAGDAAKKIEMYNGRDAKDNGGRPITRVRLGDVDTTNSYDPQKKTTYTNHVVFTFDYPNGDDGGTTNTTQDRKAEPQTKQKTVTDYANDIPTVPVEEEELPFA